jgi:hypothetical protein
MHLGLGLGIQSNGFGAALATIWGSITGTLSNQTDLQNALDAITTGYVPYVGATQDLELGSFALKASSISNNFNQPVFDLDSFIVYDGTLVTAWNIATRQFSDLSGVLSADLSQRKLFGPDGITEVLDFTNWWLVNASNIPTIFFGPDYPRILARLSISNNGILTPLNALHIDSGTATNSYLQFTAGTTTVADGFYIGISPTAIGEIRQRENKDINVFTNNVLRAVFNNAFFQSTVPFYAPLGATGSPSYAFTGDTNTGMWSPSADAIAFSTNSVERIRITSAGLVGIGTTGPNANAILDLTSTTRAFMPPRMTTTQKNAVASPTAGMVVYDSTLNKLCVRGASAWETITSV